MGNRFGLVQAALLLLIGTTAFAEVEVLWLGHATTRITSVSGKVILIDPFLRKNPLTPERFKDLEALGAVDLILVTHGHFDHVGANSKLKEVTGAELMIHALDEPMLSKLSASAASWGLNADDSPAPDKYLEDGQKLTFGEFSMDVIHTPGHSPGGVSIVSDGKVFVGDTLFAGSIGRTDFPTGDFDVLMQSIHDKLFTLDDDFTVYCGHGPSTTIGFERQYNPFCGMHANQ